MQKTKLFTGLSVFVFSLSQALPSCLELLRNQASYRWVDLIKDHHRIAAFTPHSRKEMFETSIYYPTNSSHIKGYPEIPARSQAILISMTGSGGENISGKNFMRAAKRMQQWGIAQVAFDYPFHGEGPKDEKFNHVHEFRRMLFKIIKHYKKTSLPVILQGHSFGALVIQDLLYYSSEIVEGAVITSPGGNVTPDLLEKYLIEFPPGQQAELMKGFKWKFDPVSDQWAEGLDGKTGVAGQMFSNKTGVKIKTQIPVRILAGDQDPYSTPDLIENFARRFSNATFEIFPGFGHVDVNEAPGEREKAPLNAVIDLVEENIQKKLKLSKELSIHSQEVFQYFLENSFAFQIYLQEFEKIPLLKARRFLENQNISAVDAILGRWNDFYLQKLWEAIAASNSAQKKAESLNSYNSTFFVFREYSEMNAKQKEEFKKALYNFPLSEL
jgi:pimeloyl-ACP methyl ester carboxylesterase